MHGRAAQFPEQARHSGNTVVSRHKAKSLDNGRDYKDKPGPGTKLALSWVTEDEQLGPELAGDDDEMGRF